MALLTQTALIMPVSPDRLATRPMMRAGNSIEVACGREAVRPRVRRSGALAQVPGALPRLQVWTDG